MPNNNRLIGDIEFNPFKGKLVRKLIFAVVIISSILAFFITALQLYVDYRIDVDALTEKLHEVESSYSESITESVWVLNDEQIIKQLNGIVAISGLYSASISVNGNVRWKNAIDQENPLLPLHQYTHKFKLYKTYKSSKREIGTLLLVANIDEIYESLYNKIAFIFLTNIFKTFLVSIFLVFFFNYFITRHLYHLSTYTKNITFTKNEEPVELNRLSNRRASKGDVDELDELADAINMMRDRLFESYASLSVTNVSLKNELEKNERINHELTLAKQLTESKEKELRSVVDNLVEGVFIFNENLQIIKTNQAASHIFQYSKAELFQCEVNSLIPSLEIPSIEAHLPSSSQVIESFSKIYQGLKKDGTEFSLKLSIVIISTQTPPIYICSFIDITTELQKEDQLRHSQKMEALGQLTGGISHDYNNLLHIILGYAELLRDKFQDDNESEKYIQIIQNATERGAKLTGELLAFSRHKSSHPQTVNINDLLLSEQHMLEKTLTPQIRLTLNLTKNIWSTFLDSSDFENAVLNMCINAMHAINGQGTLIIETFNASINKEKLNTDEASPIGLKQGEYVLLTVTDSGSGMDESVRKRVFDPFFSTKGNAGTGLGLSQVYGFVERSMGVIEVDSTLGERTKFSLYFPRVNEDYVNEKHNTQISALPHSVDKQITILIVDDEEALLSLTSEILEMAGYHTLMANNAEEALDALNNNQVNLVVTDIIMPDMDGFTLADEIKRQYPKVKIQLTSGFSGGHVTESDVAELGYHLLHKPFTSKQLLKSIEKMI